MLGVRCDWVDIWALAFLEARYGEGFGGWLRFGGNLGGTRFNNSSIFSDLTFLSQ